MPVPSSSPRLKLSRHSTDVAIARILLLALAVVVCLTLRAMATGAKPGVLILMFTASLLCGLGAVIAATQSTPSWRIPWSMKVLRYCFPIFVLMTLLRAVVFDSERVPTASMTPLIPAGSSVVASPLPIGIRIGDWWLWQWRVLRPGEIVTFRSVANPKETHVKRVVAVAGDTIEYSMQKRLLVNGVERKLTGSTSPLAVWYEPSFMIDSPLFKRHCSVNAERLSCLVPHDHVFVMGDNVDDSIDSRYHGVVPLKNLYSKVIWHGTLSL